MPIDVSTAVVPLLGAIAVIVAGWLGFRGVNRTAQSSEKSSIDDLTTELMSEYRTMKNELKADMESRLQNEKNERERIEQAMTAKLEDERQARKMSEETLQASLKEVVDNSTTLLAYIQWCVAGHPPPPIEVPVDAIKSLTRLQRRD